MIVWKFDHRKLREIIDSKGRKVIWVAQSAGIQRNTLSMILAGKRSPSMTLAKMLCRVLEVDESVLIKVEEVAS